MQKGVGLTVSELFAKSNRRHVDDVVREQIKIIDAKIQTAHSAGFNGIEHELPINFTINNMNKADAQTLVYSEIIKSYKTPEDEGGKGFEHVRIDIGPKSVLYINWLNGMDESEREERQNIIKSCMMVRKK